MLIQSPEFRSLSVAYQPHFHQSILN